MPAFSVFFLIWTCEAIVIPSTPADFLAIAECTGGSPICLFADAPPQTAQLVNLGSERSPQSSWPSPGGLNPP
jgi:hypothetical protein